MVRKEGYYRVKIDTENHKFYGDHWRVALWVCNNGDGSDLLWRIAGDDKNFYDNDFTEINEERIPMPGDAASKVVVLPAGVTAAQWVEITERMNGFAWLWAETTFKPKTNPKLAMGNNVIPISSEKSYEEANNNYHERVFVYEVLGKIFNPINDRFVSAELSSSWGNCLICIKKHDGSEVKIDLLALYNVKFIITGQDIAANPQLLIDKLNELLPVVDGTQPVERVLPEQPSFTPEIDAKDIIAHSETGDLLSVKQVSTGTFERRDSQNAANDVGVDTEYYADCWFKVDYTFNTGDAHMSFKCYRITGLAEQVELSDIEQRETLDGSIKWDGCMNFTSDDHHCGMFHAEQVLQVIKHIRNKANETIQGYEGDTFDLTEQDDSGG